MRRTALAKRAKRNMRTNIRILTCCGIVSDNSEAFYDELIACRIWWMAEFEMIEVALHFALCQILELQPLEGTKSSSSVNVRTTQTTDSHMEQ